jgi:hypothetical protein
VWQVIDAVNKAVCVPEVALRYHPKHVEQFPDKMNCVTLHLVGYNNNNSKGSGKEVKIQEFMYRDTTNL